MNIWFREIDKTNYNECIELSLNEEQKLYVASNMFSLVQAAYERNFYPLGVYNDNVMVGFILYDFDDELKAWSMSRFMVDKKYQNQGVGNAALAKFIDFFIKKYGRIKLYTSAEVDNTVAISLYEKHGFEKKETFEYTAAGRTYREIRMVLKP